MQWREKCTLGRLLLVPIQLWHLSSSDNASKALYHSLSLSHTHTHTHTPDQNSYRWGSYHRDLLFHQNRRPPVRGCRLKGSCLHCSPVHLHLCLHHTHRRGCQNQCPSGGCCEHWHSCRKHRQNHLCQSHAGRGCEHRHSCPAVEKAKIQKVLTLQISGLINKQ